jgi:PIN domain nuclease of toxin-antitoxin system
MERQRQNRHRACRKVRRNASQAKASNASHFQPYQLRRQARVATSLKLLYPRGHASQADRACLALALELGQPALTGDRKWRDAETGDIVELVR